MDRAILDGLIKTYRNRTSKEDFSEEDFHVLNCLIELKNYKKEKQELINFFEDIIKCPHCNKKK